MITETILMRAPAPFTGNLLCAKRFMRVTGRPIPVLQVKELRHGGRRRHPSPACSFTLPSLWSAYRAPRAVCPWSSEQSRQESVRSWTGHSGASLPVLGDFLGSYEKAESLGDPPSWWGRA